MKKYITEIDADHIRLYPLPMCCHAMLIYRVSDDTHWLLVNENYNYDIRNEAVVHELIHLAHGDFDSGEPIALCEERAQNNAKKIKAPIIEAERRKL